jgi:hypothetical protein
MGMNGNSIVAAGINGTADLFRGVRRSPLISGSIQGTGIPVSPSSSINCAVRNTVTNLVRGKCANTTTSRVEKILMHLPETESKMLSRREVKTDKNGSSRSMNRSSMVSNKDSRISNKDSRISKIGNRIRGQTVVTDKVSRTMTTAAGDTISKLL